MAWRPFSRLILVKDKADWVIDEEMKALARISSQLGVRVASGRWDAGARRQCVFYGSQFFLLAPDWITSSHRIAVAYFHGKPGTGFKDFDDLFQRVCQHGGRISRIQVSHSEMRDILLDAGLPRERVHLIPIGINLDYFPLQTPESRRQARERFGLPVQAALLGSFQKDGCGWGQGLEPKLIKGPDILLETCRILKARVPELFIVLSGPARGYVMNGLRALGIPYKHFLLEHYAEVGHLFQTLDGYLIPARQEGGPKAVLESMASGVPLVSTRVGQAMDLIDSGRNGYLVDVGDAEGLAHWTQVILEHKDGTSPLVQEGRATAEAHTYDRQRPLWERFLEGFVERKGPA